MEVLMTKTFKIITAPIISLVLLLSMTSAGGAETTISAEGQYIFNTLAFYIGAFIIGDTNKKLDLKAFM